MQGTEKLRANVLLGLPSAYNMPKWQSAVSALNNHSDPDVRVSICQEGGSAQCQNFNRAWINGLGNVNHPFTHFAMLHEDIEASPRWITTLLDVMDRTGADLVSAVVPIKNNHGLTSTATGDPDDLYDYRRLMMKDIMKLPESFSIDDLPELKAQGKCLLINTGCWIADLRRDFWSIKNERGEFVFKFHIENRMTQWPNGVFCPEFAPEDWNWSRVCHKYGAKVVATRAVRVLHHGNQTYPNFTAWGDDNDEEIDSFLKAKAEAYSLTPILKTIGNKRDMNWEDIPGWFNFQDVYANAVKAAKDGDHFVEVGSWLGRSTAYMGSAIKESGKIITFYAVDTWKGSSNEPDMLAQVASAGGSVFDKFKQNMKACNVNNLVKPIEKPSLEASKMFEDSSLAFVFIDGEHSKESVTEDIKAWYSKMKPGGLFAGHDFELNDVRVAVLDFAKSHNLSVGVSGTSWFIQTPTDPKEAECLV